MKARSIPIHPPFFAAFPILAFFSANVHLFPVRDIWAPIEISIAAVCGIWLLISFLGRNVRRAACAVSVFSLGLFLFGFFLTGQADDWVRFSWIGFVLGLSILAYRYSLATAVWNSLGLLLVLTSGSTVVGKILASPPSYLAPSAAQSSRSNSANPDIFYIILDGYGRTDALQKYIGYSNQDFVDALTQKGFVVERKSHANYCQTELSLSSSLNLDFVQKLLPEVKADDRDRSRLDKLIHDNRLVRYLSHRGYETVAITTGFPPFEDLDVERQREVLTKVHWFDASVWALLPFRDLGGVQDEEHQARRELLTGAFTALKQESAVGKRPKFVFVHILAPHPPFVFGANGQPVTFEDRFGFYDGSDYKAMHGGIMDSYSPGYTGQVQWLNTQVLSALDMLLRRPGPKPIIILQGDHGSKRFLNQNHLTKTIVEECFPNLAAFYVPEMMKSHFYAGITPVNEFRIVLNSVFGEKLPLRPDRSWYSGFIEPYRFYDVTSRVVTFGTPF